MDRRTILKSLGAISVISAASVATVAKESKAVTPKRQEISKFNIEAAPDFDAPKNSIVEIKILPTDNYFEILGVYYNDQLIGREMSHLLDAIASLLKTDLVMEHYIEDIEDCVKCNDEPIRLVSIVSYIIT